ncbi:hypothetical protein GNI_049540 [Gregarina niphandrodes]|uniref:Uncharacterized protein n=1 Tax=Gregarina niphandrodes TaxID=110365 RepID=A0A023B9H8_GRENI|nr:hypothetical protein GNI_049540 [Gregarina niphandrodes]EZG72977.1 hypothetical protein GNI_049540 [Gregarina niphandrodes]|eukprot:XP_011129672.1 hypothetical protein GNI_049540 [Gregarina niphandrodes]
MRAGPSRKHHLPVRGFFLAMHTRCSGASTSEGGHQQATAGRQTPVSWPGVWNDFGGAPPLFVSPGIIRPVPLPPGIIRPIPIRPMPLPPGIIRPIPIRPVPLPPGIIRPVPVSIQHLTGGVVPAGPPDVGPWNIGPVKMNPNYVDPLEVDPLEVEPQEVEPLKVEPLEVESLEVESLEVESLEFNPLKVNPLKVDPLKVDPLKVDLVAAPEEEAPEKVTSVGDVSGATGLEAAAAGAFRSILPRPDVSRSCFRYRQCGEIPWKCKIDLEALRKENVARTRWAFLSVGEWSRVLSFPEEALRSCRKGYLEAAYLIASYIRYPVGDVIPLVKFKLQDRFQTLRGLRRDMKPWELRIVSVHLCVWITGCILQHAKVDPARLEWFCLEKLKYKSKSETESGWNFASTYWKSPKAVISHPKTPSYLRFLFEDDTVVELEKFATMTKSGPEGRRAGRPRKNTTPYTDPNMDPQDAPLDLSRVH